VSNEATYSSSTTYSSSIGVEEIIATISVLILASIFIGYYLWPSSDSTAEVRSATAQSANVPLASIETNKAIASTEEPAAQKQSLSLSGESDTGARVSVEINGGQYEQTLADSSGNWSLSTDLDQAENIEIEINASATKSTSTEPTSTQQQIARTETIVETNEGVEEATLSVSNQTSVTSDIESSNETSEAEFADINDLTATTEQAPLQTAMISPEAVPEQASEPADPSAGLDITEPVITYLDRDRTTNELIISGSAPDSESHVVLLINGITTNPVKIGPKNKWRYRFKAGPGEYYVRVTPANAEGAIVRADALPTLYNISLAPVTPDSTEAGAEISLLPGGFMHVEAGQNLFQISQKTNIKVSDLMLVNGIRDEKSLKAGDVLFIPTGQ